MATVLAHYYYLLCHRGLLRVIAPMSPHVQTFTLWFSKGFVTFFLHSCDTKKLAHCGLKSGTFEPTLITVAFGLESVNLLLIVCAPPSNRTMRTKTIGCPSTGTRRTHQAVVDSRSLAIETSVKSIAKEVVVIGKYILTRTI